MLIKRHRNDIFRIYLKALQDKQTFYFGKTLGFSIIPILFIVIYNSKKGKTIFGTISIVVTVIFFLITALGRINEIMY